MHVIVTFKYEKEWIKNSREKVETPFFSIITLSVTMEASIWIWPNFKLIQALMYLIITCKYKKGSDQEKPRKIGDIVFPIISLWGFFRRSMAANSTVGGPIRPKFKLAQPLMHVIIACKYEKDQMKNSREKVETPFSPL